MEKTGLRRSYFTLLQDHQTGSHGAPTEAQLCFHFHSHFGGMDNKNIFAFARADRGYTLVLPRLARGTHTILAGGVGFRRHFHQCDCNHDLRKQEVIRRNFRVWHSPLALADLEKQLAVS